ncbi:MAG TPA: SGNH/GDSL hydrolase family protein [Terrimicrobiaceae bacterium]|jgi:acyl-CoA thioesterase I|nr:SGNH/GDSL hydrolase family protein [Terrimicrobiaceae bacterium]
MALPLSRDSRWIFVGDSITDSGRRQCPESVGTGYVRDVQDWLRASLPAQAPQIINKGISGTTMSDLRRRWEADVIADNPQLVSILIGINDVLHGLGGLAGTSVENYRMNYADILGRLKNALPQVTIVLCEPTAIWPPTSAAGSGMLKPFVEAVQHAAVEFGARGVVPLHRAFEKAISERPDIDWLPDGVHPSSSGHMLIARSWLACLGLL